MLMNYEQFCEFTEYDIQRIDESRIADIKDKVFNKSRELGKGMKDAVKKASKISKREARQTLMALDIISKKMLKGKKISPEEAKFIKAQGKNLAKIIPLIAIQGIPASVPITSFLLAYGKKYGIDLSPKAHIEPEDYKDKTYNPITNYKRKRSKKQEKEYTEDYNDNV